MIELPLISNKHQGVVALIDDEDIELCKLKWYLKEVNPLHRSAVTFTIKPKRTITLLHRLIMNAPKGKCVDHIDGDGLNCQRSNLRVCTQSQNMANKHRRRANCSSRFNGVHWDNLKKKWRASIGKDGKKHFAPKNFDSEIEAAKAYNELAKKYHGEFARLHDVS